LFPFLGEDFFPSVDAGRFDMHVRMKAGTRIEETARVTDQIEQIIRQIIPANQLEGIIDNLGIPYSGINLSYNTSGTASAADGDILVSLKESHSSTNQFIREIRTRIPGIHICGILVSSGRHCRTDSELRAACTH
jgi:multidrug efflux pump subunit AcrB